MCINELVTLIRTEVLYVLLLYCDYRTVHVYILVKVALKLLYILSALTAL